MMDPYVAQRQRRNIILFIVATIPPFIIPGIEQGINDNSPQNPSSERKRLMRLVRFYRTPSMSPETHCLLWCNRRFLRTHRFIRAQETIYVWTPVTLSDSQERNQSGWNVYKKRCLATNVIGFYVGWSRFTPAGKMESIEFQDATQRKGVPYVPDLKTMLHDKIVTGSIRIVTTTYIRHCYASCIIYSVTCLYMFSLMSHEVK